MAASKDVIIQDIKRYVDELKRNGIPVQKTLLFGSWSKNSANEDSDIDIALISDAFTGDRFQDRRKIVPFRRKINSRIEPIPFTEQTFKMGGNLVDEIVRYGEDIR